MYNLHVIPFGVELFDLLKDVETTHDDFRIFGGDNQT